MLVCEVAGVSTFRGIREGGKEGRFSERSWEKENLRSLDDNEKETYYQKGTIMSLKFREKTTC